MQLQVKLGKACYDRRLRYGRHGRSVKYWLLCLGLDYYAIRGQRPGVGIGQENFWQKYDIELPAILRDAHRSWKRSMKFCYLTSDAYLLNTAWVKVKQMMGRHGVSL